MMYFCAWCERELDLVPGNLQGEPTVKHGICDECLERQLALVGSEPAPQAQGGS